VTFGAFSELFKVNDRVLGVWARVLGAVPGSRLLLKNRAPERPDAARHLMNRAAAAGIDLSRVELVARTGSYTAHLAMYDRVDVALDTFPYNGTTTICESLLMGVPMVGMVPAPEHDRHAARVGLSVLTNAGVPELIARDVDDYVALAADLARDAGRLIELRGSLRGRLLASDLCAAGPFAARMGAALRAMWRERCAAEGVRR
jgi:predicted O-linked N-acetylglucosamine transferase (SPINDLY family)